MRLISIFKDKLETLKIEIFEYHDLLMIFPSHRRLVADWEEQNVTIDQLTLENRRYKKNEMKRKLEERRIEVQCKKECEGTRRLSYEAVPKSKRYSQIIEILEDIKQGSAMDIAKEMRERGYVIMLERNSCHPRLNELMEEGVVEVIDKKVDERTKRKVAVYALTEQFKEVRTFNYDEVTLQDIENNNRFIFECNADSKKLVLKKEF